MPKVFKQKCWDAWLQHPDFKTWLRKDNTDASRVFCSYCKCTLTAKLRDLCAHAATKKHSKTKDCLGQTNKLRFFKLPNKTIDYEAALSLFVAQHTAIAQIDHLSSMCIVNLEICNCRLASSKIFFYDNLRSDIYIWSQRGISVRSHHHIIKSRTRLHKDLFSLKNVKKRRASPKHGKPF